MIRFVVTILTMALALSLVVACGVDKCEDAFNKQRDCFANADCSKAGSAADVTTCNSLKLGFSILTYQQSVDACEKLTPGGNCGCHEVNQAAADKILACPDIDKPFPACYQNCMK